MRNRRNTLIQQLEHFRLLKYFVEVFSRDNNDGTWKVKYDLIKGTIEYPNSAIIVGDTEADIKAGKELGITTYGLTCGIRNSERIKNADPDIITESTLEFFKKFVNTFV